MTTERKNSVIKDMWIAFRKDDRPHCDDADDSMNKVLKTVYCVFGYGAYMVIVELQKFFV